MTTPNEAISRPLSLAQLPPPASDFWHKLDTALIVPERLTDVRGWHPHIPFAFWLVDRSRPRRLVELGTHKGDSYSAFCQAVERLQIGTECHAVDTWQGDEQSSRYGEDVFQDLSRYHARYASFSELIRSSFDAAQPHFADGSIDLLHIDGLHTYEAVRHDFEFWRPKLSDRAVVLFHDVNVRERGFEVWRYWEELRTKFPHFTFLHGHGLGVLAVGSKVPDDLDVLFQADSLETQSIRRVFSSLGNAVQRMEEGVHSRRAEDLAELRHAVEQLRMARLENEAQRSGIEDLKARLTESAAECAEVTERLHHSEARLGDLEILRTQAAADGRAAREEFDGLHAEFIERFSRLEARRAELEQELLRSKSELIAAQHQAAAALLAESEKLRQSQLLSSARLGELNALRASRSWRVTAPLRSLAEQTSRTGKFFKILRTLYWALTFQLFRRRRAAAISAAISESGLFDAGYYLACNRDVLESGCDPLVHYLSSGAAEGRDPGPAFSSSYYLRQNADVREAGMNPLLHYVLHGARENRLPTPVQPGPAPAAPPPLPVAESLSPPVVPAPETPELAPLPRDATFLVVDYRLLTPDMDSGSLRMFSIVHLLLRLGHSVTFVADVDTIDRSYAARLEEIGALVLWGLPAAQEYLRVVGPRLKYALLSRPSVGERYTPTIRAYAPNAQLIYDSVDLHWLRLRREAELKGDSASAQGSEEVRKVERFAFQSADIVLAITEPERKAIEMECPGVRTEIIPNIHRLGPQPKPWSRREGLMFIGGYEHPPNVDAVIWFAKEVMPLILRELPEAHFKMVGSKPPESLNALVSSSVELVGYVPDCDPYFEEARVFVAPLRYGAGMKGKIGQAMSLGLPVVTTSIGAEGMLLRDGEQVLIADDPEQFAKAVVRVYRDESLWNSLRDAALVHVDRHFSEAAAMKALERLLREASVEGKSEAA